jgi:hypothetical protein
MAQQISGSYTLQPPVLAVIGSVNATANDVIATVYQGEGLLSYAKVNITLAARLGQLGTLRLLGCAVVVEHFWKGLPLWMHCCGHGRARAGKTGTCLLTPTWDPGHLTCAHVTSNARLSLIPLI